MSEKFQLVLDVAQKAQVPAPSLPLTLGGRNPNPEALQVFCVLTCLFWSISLTLVRGQGIHGFLMNLWPYVNRAPHHQG